jgi:mannosyltransferase OCH1-like enzyme
MTEYAIIPKVLPARTSVEYYQKIPKIIWQTMKTNRVPVSMKDYADTWIDLNPEYEYRLQDDNDIINFIKKDFPDYLEGYKKLKYGASKADLWRYLIIYKYGGVYADMDCRCVNPLRQWINPESAYVTQLGTNKDICQWLIISVPENPIFLKAANKTLRNIEQKNIKAAHHGFELNNNNLTIRVDSPLNKFVHPVLGQSGPPVLQSAAEDCFEEGSICGIIAFTQIVCVSGKAISCQMNGNVTHGSGGHKAYRKALSLLKTNHYESGLILKIKMKFIVLINAGISILNKP